MGLKFRDKISAGLPSPGDVKERELQLDLKNRSIYSSTNGTDLVKISEPGVGGRMWDATIEYEPGDLVIRSHTFAGGIVNAYYGAKTGGNIGNDPLTDTVNWEEANIVSYLSKDLNLTVGGHGAVAGDFDNIETCLLFLSRFVLVDGAKCTLTILTGHVVDYYVDVTNLHMDITVVSENGVTIVVDISAIGGTTYVAGSIFSFINCSGLIFEFSINVIGSLSSTSAQHAGIFVGGVTYSGSTMTINANNVGKYAYIVLGGASIVKCKIIFNKNWGGVAQNSKGGTVSSTTISGVGVLAYYIFYCTGGDTYLSGVTVNVKSTRGNLTSERGAKVMIASSDMQMGTAPVANDMKVLLGGTIHLYNGVTGGTNIAKNTFTANGIIYQ